MTKKVTDKILRDLIMEVLEAKRVIRKKAAAKKVAHEYTEIAYDKEGKKITKADGLKKHLGDLWTKTNMSLDSKTGTLTYTDNTDWEAAIEPSSKYNISIGSDGDITFNDYTESSTSSSSAGGSSSSAGGAVDPLVKGLTKKIPSKFKKPSPEYSEAIAKIPEKFKSVILRNFQALLDPDNSGDDEALKDIASIAENILREDIDKLGWEDFATILLNPTSKLYRPALLTIKQVANAYKDEPWAKSLKSVADNQEALPSVTNSGRPTYATMNVDISDLQGRDRAKVPPYIIDIFNNLGLSSAPTVKERIEILNNMTSKIVDKTLTKEDTLLSEVMSAIGVVNSLSRIVKNMDDKAAGWAFESFLAQLANGTTEGTAMGAADFQFGIAPGGEYGTGKVAGSAKLIKGKDSSQAFSTMSALLSNTAKPKVPEDASKWKPKHRTRAIAALSGYGRGLAAVDKDTNEQILAKINKISWDNNEVVYIIGQKVDAKDSGTADPSKVTAIKLNMIKIKRTKGSGPFTSTRNTRSNTFTTVGGSISDISVSSGPDKFGFEITEDKPLGTLYLSNSVESLAELSQAALKTMDDNLPELLKQIEGFQRDSQSYLATGNASKIEAALSSYTSLYALINSVFGSPKGKAAESSGVIGKVQTKSGGGLEYTTSALQEQKITANFLKKLISESFKK